MERHDTLLIVSASKETRSHLRHALETRYHLLEATNPNQALPLLRQNIECIAALVVDMGDDPARQEELLCWNQEKLLLEQIPVIVICQEDSHREHARYFRSGASDVIPVNYDPYAMLHRIENIAELHKHKQHLEVVVQEQADILRQSSDNMVDVLSTIIEYRSIETGNHVLRMRNYTKVLMDEVMRLCPEYGLTERQTAIIASASVLHDIGKISIPDAILMKPGPLNKEEWETMKSHSITGCRILGSLGQSVEEEYLRYAYNICHYHHERWDGTGYPEGLSGNDIPICAQVVGLTDAYDALTSRRVYKDAYSYANAVNMILNGECGAFSPRLLECFKNVTKQFELLSKQYADGETPVGKVFDMTLPPPAPLQAGSLERTRAKYFALVHYIDAFLVEIELDERLFHVVYNPYPELTQLDGIQSVDDLEKLMLDQIVVPQEREQMADLIYRQIPEFVSEDLRRVTYRFHYQKSGSPGGCPFELTLLRIGASGGRRSLAVLCRKIPDFATGGEKAPPTPQTGCILRNDQMLTLERMGRATLGLGHHSVQALERQMNGSLMNLVHPEDRVLVREAFRTQLRSGPTVEVEHRLLMYGEEVLWVVNRCRLIQGKDGREYIYCVLTDITPSKRAYERLLSRMNRYEIILAQTENVLFEWDVERGGIEFSDNWQEVFGYPLESDNLIDLIQNGGHIHPDDTPLLLDRIADLENGSDYELCEVRVANIQGRYIWCRFRATAVRRENGQLHKVVGIVLNIDQEKQNQRALEDSSQRDSLTKLLNNATARKQAESYLSRFAKGVSCALLIIDLDNFKQINDKYGHLFGDAVLCKVSRELERLFRAQDIISRIGGDEFLVLARGVSDRALLEQRCGQILDAFHNAFQQPRLSASVGVALCPEHGATYQELFAHADEALYQAKAMGKNEFCFYGSFEGQSLLNSRNTAVNDHIDSDVELGLAQDNLVRYVFQRLYAAKDVEGAVNNAMALLGRAMNVSRVYVFENSLDDSWCDNTFEWCNEGILPEIHNLQRVSYVTDIPEYEQNFNEEGIFHCPNIQELPQQVREILEPQGIHSMLQCAIRQEGRFRGYIGFDECVCQRLWTQEEIQTLNYFSNVLSTFLLKHREEERAKRQAAELQFILDNQNSWIYIIDPDTRALRYVNSQIRQNFASVPLNTPCYRALLGREERCIGCPAQNIRNTRTGRSFLWDERYQKKLLSEAALIQWEGQDACLMTCRALPEE